MVTHPELQNLIAKARHRERLATVEAARRHPADRPSGPLARLSARLHVRRRHDRTDDVVIALNPRNRPSLVIDLGS